MRDDRVTAGTSLRHEILVSDLRKCARCQRLVRLTIRLVADFGHSR